MRSKLLKSQPLVNGQQTGSDRRSIENSETNFTKLLNHLEEWPSGLRHRS